MLKRVKRASNLVTSHFFDSFRPHLIANQSKILLNIVKTRLADSPSQLSL